MQARRSEEAIEAPPCTSLIAPATQDEVLRVCTSRLHLRAMFQLVPGCKLRSWTTKYPGVKTVFCYQVDAESDALLLILNEIHQWSINDVVNLRSPVEPLLLRSEPGSASHEKVCSNMPHLSYHNPTMPKCCRKLFQCLKSVT